MTQVERVRQRIQDQFQSPEQMESSKKDFVESFPNLLLDQKRNHLKEYIMMINENPDDLATLKSILIQYQDSFNHSVHSVKDFCFGTQIMRIFYLLNLPDDAVKVIEHKKIFDSSPY